MGILVVHPEKAAIRGRRQAPGQRRQRRSRRLWGVAFRHRPRGLVSGQEIVEAIEAGGGTGVAAQHPVADDCRCVPAGVAKAVRQRDALCWQHRQVAGDTELLGVASGQERRDRGQGVGGGSVGRGEDQAACGQRVELRSQADRAAVRAEPVGTQCVDAQQDDEPCGVVPRARAAAQNLAAAKNRAAAQKRQGAAGGRQPEAG